MEEKEVYIYQATPAMHSHARLMMANPPKGYKFVYNPNKNKMGLLRILSSSKLIKSIYRNILKKIFDLTKLREKAYSSNIPHNTELIFSESQALDVNRPWILHMIDSVYSLAGNDYSLFMKTKDNIEKMLLSESCRKIIVVNESTMSDMKKYFNEQVMKKAILIRAAVKPQIFKRSYKKRNLTILFMGSIANPDDFYMKGGLEALETFKELTSKYKNINLIVRCKTPKDVLKKYSKSERIEFLDNTMEQKKIKELYKKADILLNPAHVYPLMTILESMSFGLPIIMLDTYGVRDYLSEKNAMIIAPSKEITGYKDPSYPTNVRTKNFMDEIKKTDKKVIGRLYLAAKLLINDKNLRKRLGNNSIQVVKRKFSLNKRNALLKRAFDEAIKD